MRLRMLLERKKSPYQLSIYSDCDLHSISLLPLPVAVLRYHYYPQQLLPKMLLLQIFKNWKQLNQLSTDLWCIDRAKGCFMITLHTRRLGADFSEEEGSRVMVLDHLGEVIEACMRSAPTAAPITRLELAVSTANLAYGLGALQYALALLSPSLESLRIQYGVVDIPLLSYLVANLPPALRQIELVFSEGIAHDNAHVIELFTQLIEAKPHYWRVKIDTNGYFLRIEVPFKERLRLKVDIL